MAVMILNCNVFSPMCPSFDIRNWVLILLTSPNIETTLLSRFSLIFRGITTPQFHRYDHHVPPPPLLSPLSQKRKKNEKKKKKKKKRKATNQAPTGNVKSVSTSEEFARAASNAYRFSLDLPPQYVEVFPAHLKLHVNPDVEFAEPGCRTSPQ
jgi:hypothetical protein